MICSSGYIKVDCKEPNQQRIDEAKWLIPEFESANKTVNHSYSILDIRHNLNLDTGLKYGYHCKGAIVIMLLEAGFTYKLTSFGEPLFNLSKKFKLKDSE